MRGVWVVAAGALLLPAPAAAHGPPPPPAPDEPAAFAQEAAAIGHAHALEHLLAARARSAAPPRGRGAQSGGFDPCAPRGPASSFDFDRPRPPELRPTGQARCGTLPPQPRVAEALARLGRWTSDVQDLPHYAIHAALLPTGKVLFWGFEWTQTIITRAPGTHQETSSVATIWDPAKGNGLRAFKPVPAPRIDVDGDGRAEPVPLYCSGQSFLPDGRVLVTGGTLDLRWAERGFKNPPGIKVALVFDPRTETWSRAPDMAVARWYPTQVKLADGRTLVLGGFDDRLPVNDFTDVLEGFSPDARRVTRLASGDRRTWTYPGLLLLPSGNVLLGGPQQAESALLDTKTMRWRALPPLPVARGGSNLVPVPTRSGTSPQAMLVGGADFPRPGDGRSPEFRATRRVDVLDEDRSAQGWRRAPSQNRPRNWPNTVLLPDGSMATVGGGTRVTRENLAYESAPANRRVELWDPRTGRWRLGPAQREDRTYHSVALLLPDGRIWSAGDDGNPNRDGDTGEVYEPPYLHRGARPRVVAAPRALRAGRRFAVTVRGAAPDRVTLVAPGATTHGLDMHQRFAELRVVRRERRDGRSWRLTVEGPVSRAAMPPGPAMLFALSARGAPSVARWVTVR